MSDYHDCKCGYWMNTNYDVCPLKECRKPILNEVNFFDDEKVDFGSHEGFDESETYVILIDPEEKCILVENLTNKP